MFNKRSRFNISRIIRLYMHTSITVIRLLTCMMRYVYMLTLSKREFIQ